LLVACATALAAAITALSPRAARAGNGNVTPPPVPPGLEVTGSTAFLEGHAIGTQNYICLPSGSGFAFKLFTPEATLFTDNDKQLITHFFSPNPNPSDFDASGKPRIRATWQDSKDTSIVWGGDATAATHDTDPDFVAEGAIAWLKLPAAGVQEGPKRGDTLTATTFIQRLNTSGGLAPSTGCALSTDVGNEAFVPYTADYFFYK